jgi:hypothetical protein
MEKSKSEDCNVLVVDNNKVFAGFVKEALQAHIKNASIDIAVNVWELKRKLACKTYKFIIADLSVATDGPEIAEEFEKLEIPVYCWTSGNSHTKELQGKPSSLNETSIFLKKNLPTFLEETA